MRYFLSGFVLHRVDLTLGLGTFGLNISSSILMSFAVTGKFLITLIHSKRWLGFIRRWCIHNVVQLPSFIGMLQLVQCVCLCNSWSQYTNQVTCASFNLTFLQVSLGALLYLSLLSAGKYSSWFLSSIGTKLWYLMVQKIVGNKLYSFTYMASMHSLMLWCFMMSSFGISMRSFLIGFGLRCIDLPFRLDAYAPNIDIYIASIVMGQFLMIFIQSNDLKIPMPVYSQYGKTNMLLWHTKIGV